MRKLAALAAGGGALALAAGIAVLAPEQAGFTADHLDPPSRTDPAEDSTPDRAADIADIYAWQAGDRVNMVLTFAGPAATDQPATYDPDVLYKINVSNAAPATNTEIPIRIRFGTDGADNTGIQVLGIPGTGSGGITGPVETNLNEGGVLVRAGLFDDPFFFDLQGFRTTRMTGTLSFDSSRDFFAGKNVTAVVLSIPRDRLGNSSTVLDIWSETRRFGGQL